MSRRRRRSRLSGYARVPRRQSPGATRLMAKPRATMVKRVKGIRTEAAEAITGAGSTDELDQIRVRYLGRKAELTGILRGIAELPAEERGPVGQAANEARAELEGLFERRAENGRAACRERGAVGGGGVTGKEKAREEAEQLQEVVR